MKVNSKKLLSWLCVIAMVLSLAPVMDLSNFAVETQAATVGGQNLPSGISEVIQTGNGYQTAALALDPTTATTCPIHGDLTKLSSTEGWVKMPTTKSLVTANKGKHYHYYIDEDNKQITDLTSTSTAVGTTVCILLNRNATITGSNGIRPAKGVTFNFFGSGTLTSTSTTMFDVRGTLNLFGGRFVPTATNTNGAIYFNDAGTGERVVNIYDGVTIGPETTATSETTSACMNMKYKGTVGNINMYGGTIQNGVSGTSITSGNVHVASGATFNMYGGTISGGRYITLASGYARGANLYAAGTVNIYGGTITGGECDNGGNIALAGSSTFKMEGGTVKLGNATNGGNIWSASANSTIGGTALIEDGSADNGGNIYMYADTATATISGGTIQEGTNNVYIYKGTCTMTGGTITGGERSGAGANVYLYGEDANFYMQGGVISRGYNTANEAKTRAASVQVNSGGSFTLTEGVRLENQATLVDNEGYDAWYATDDDAMAAYDSTKHQYITMALAAQEIDKDLVVNTKGYDLELTGSGAVTLIDTANNDFETEPAKVTLAPGVTLAAKEAIVNDGRHYVTIMNSDGTYSAHYVVMDLTNITLRTTENGVYYKIQIKSDDTLAERVTKYGVVVATGKNAMPYDLNSEYVSERVDFVPDEETHAVTANSMSVFNILNETRDADVNYDYLIMKVWANLYIQVDTDGDGTGELTAMGYQQGTECGMSLLEVVQNINKNWETVQEKNPNAIPSLKTFVGKWNEGNLTAAGNTEWQAAIANITEA